MPINNQGLEDLIYAQSDEDSQVELYELYELIEQDNLKLDFEALAQEMEKYGIRNETEVSVAPGFTLEDELPGWTI